MIKKEGGKMCDCKATDNADRVYVNENLQENIYYIHRIEENGDAIEMVCMACHKHIDIVNVNNYYERNYDEYKTN